MLLNRPDIQQAERELIAANAAIGAARAAFFPNVSITAGAGSNVLHLSDLFESGSGMWTFTPSVNIPIFTGGLNLANLEAAEAGQKIAVANYESTIQSAFREVADALSTEGTIENELKAREDLADASTQAYGLADSRYRHGAATYLEVLHGERPPGAHFHATFPRGEPRDLLQGSRRRSRTSGDGRDDEAGEWLK